MNVLMQKLPQPINILVVQFNTFRCGDHFAPKTFSHVSPPPLVTNIWALLPFYSSKVQKWVPTTPNNQHSCMVTFLNLKHSGVGLIITNI